MAADPKAQVYSLANRRLATIADRPLDAASLEVRHHVQRTLEAFLSRNDLSVYYSLPSFRAARRVLQLGCGNGCHVSSLASRFPDKQFIGIDQDEAMIEIAKRDQHNENVHFAVDRMDSIWPEDFGRFDFIIARFFVGHLPAVDPFLNQVVSLLDRHAALLVYGPDDRQTRLFPPAPAYDEPLERLAHKTFEQFVGRREVEVVARRCHRIGLTDVRTLRRVHPAADREDRERLSTILLHALLTEGDDVDGHGLALALNAWAQDPRSFGQITTRVCIAKRRVAGAYTLGRRSWLRRASR